MYSNVLQHQIEFLTVCIMGLPADTPKLTVQADTPKLTVQGPICLDLYSLQHQLLINIANTLLYITTIALNTLILCTGCSKLRDTVKYLDNYWVFDKKFSTEVSWFWEGISVVILKFFWRVPFEEVNFCFINGTLYFLGHCMPEMSIFSTRFEEIFIQLTISHEKHVCKTNIEVKKFF